MTTAPLPDKADITDIRDWALALVLALPLLLALSANLFAFDYAGLFPAIHLAVHYALYLVGLALVLGQFAQEALRIRVPGWAGWAGRLLALIIIADIAVPFQLVASFAVLKALFYLLVPAQLTAFLLIERRHLRWSGDPAPLTLLLGLTTILFFQESAASAGAAGWLVAAAMLVLTVLQFLGWPRLGRQRGLLMLAAGAGACLLAGVALFQAGFSITVSPNLPAITVPPTLDVALPFAVYYVCLFLYLMALSLYEGEARLKLPGRPAGFNLNWVSPVLFAAAFFFIYVHRHFA